MDQVQWEVELPLVLKLLVCSQEAETQLATRDLAALPHFYPNLLKNHNYFSDNCHYSQFLLLLPYCHYCYWYRYCPCCLAITVPIISIAIVVIIIVITVTIITNLTLQAKLKSARTPNH